MAPSSLPSLISSEDLLNATGFGVATPFHGASRLSPATRALAARYLSGEIGRTMQTATFEIAPKFLEQHPWADDRYAEAVRLIAEQAPLRILPGERLAGAATLLEATWHRTPLTEFHSVSHTTLGFEKALHSGCLGIRETIDTRLRRSGLDEAGQRLLQAMRVCLDALGTWHARYVRALERLVVESEGDEQRHYAETLATLRHVPENPPTTFREALQSLWLLWNFQRLCGNWSGIGRLDYMLGPFLRRDLDCGRITLDEARELLAHFWIKGCEWITTQGRGESGDAQFYQNIVLAGVDEHGASVLNEVTDLVFDVVEELHISDFPIAVRLSASSPDCLLRRVAQIQRLGGGIVAVYNDDRIIPSLIKFGYPLAEARNYANDGCWEILIPGKTSFGYQPFDALLLLQEVLGLSSTEPDAATPAKFPDFESLYAAFHQRMATIVESLFDQNPFYDLPCPLASLLVDDCIARGLSYTQGGPTYTVRSPHVGGLPDVVNSLLVIRRLVYEKNELTLDELTGILKSNWENHDLLRHRIRSRFDFYGNDSDEADTLMQQVFNDYTGLVGATRERHGVLRPAGISSFGREGAAFLPHRTAAASGHHKGDVLAGNFSPSPGTDRQGPTAVIRSHCAVDFSRLPCGTALDLKIIPYSVQGESGLQALAALMRTFVQLGGIFMQIDVVDNALLREAQANPEKYTNLSVRVSGWSARFASLAKNWQDMIISRTEQQSGAH